MTLEEKAALCSGKDFWHMEGIEKFKIPSLMLTDGPHGLRKQEEGADHLGIQESVKSTCFPTAAGLASSWNRSLIMKMGEALGKECQAEDVSIILGPGANIKRSPLCGRNFEYFSEDPYLSSEIAEAHIEGVQSQGIGTSLKHFVANNQEHRRMTIDTIVDERTLREIYLASFENAIKKANPWTVMASYNKINGKFVSESGYFLNDILRDEWGFNGFVVSDWGGVNERVDALANGLDLEMPPSGKIGEQKIIDAVKYSELPEEVLDKAVERLLVIIKKALESKQNNAAYDKENHHQLAREIARESMVLLKNDDEILPLKKNDKIAVIGEFANSPRYQGGGSSHINPTKLDNILDEIQMVSDKKVMFAKGYDLASDEVDNHLIDEAKEVAKQAEKVILFVGLPERYESEGYDREHMRMPDNHLQLIESISEVNPNVIGVLSNGAPVEMPWLNKVKGLLESYLGGQALGGGITDLLYGIANPSGKLTETFPKKISDTPSYLNFPGEGDKVEYKEGIFVGYRYYDKKEIDPLFPFGYGLSYTTFEYNNLTIDQKEMKDTETTKVTVNVKNTGSLPGKEIVQLYVRDVESQVVRPEKELKGFEKVELQPGEDKTVTFILDQRSFAYYNVDVEDWHVESGEFNILIGKSSREIVLKDSIWLQSTVIHHKPIDRNITIGDLLAHPILSSVATEMLSRMNEGNPAAEATPDDNVTSDMMEAMAKYMPLRALMNFSQGSLTEDMLSDMIHMLNEQLNEQTTRK